MATADDSSGNTPLLQSKPAETVVVERTGTVWTAVAHIVTGVIGSGVLSLAWSIAQLGWIAGPVAMLVFASITLVSAFLLCNSYRSPDPEYGPDRNPTYLDAVNLHLGQNNAYVCGFFVHLSLYGLTIAYVVTSAISMRAIQNTICHQHQHQDLNSDCSHGTAYYMLLFGVVQLLLSQLPNFHKIEWLSVVAAIMSFAYAFIGFGLSIMQIVENGYIKGSIYGITTYDAADKWWLVAQGLGDIAFSYPYAVILIEIQDTLKSPPPENLTMKKASTMSIAITTFFYLCCACSGYAAFGKDTPGNLLTGFAHSKPHWLVDFANACILIHLIGAYQVYSQPLFANVENWCRANFRNSEFVNNEFTLKLPLLPAFRLNFFKPCFRIAYVASTTLIAMIFPYFNQLLGVLGGLIFWPLTIYYPVEMYLKQNGTEAWTAKWVVFRGFSITCLIVNLFALAGSIEGLINAKLG